MEKHLMHCPACNEIMSKTANKCPKCGFDFAYHSGLIKEKMLAGERMEKHLMHCSACNEIMSRTANKCPKCGHPAEKATSFFGWIMVIVLVVFLMNIL